MTNRQDEVPTGHLSANIRHFRLAKGWTQRELGEELNVESNQVARWERGFNLPRIQNLSPLAAALGVTEQQLLSPREGAPEEPQPWRLPKTHHPRWAALFEAALSAMATRNETPRKIAKDAAALADQALIVEVERFPEVFDE